MVLLSILLHLLIGALFLRSSPLIERQFISPVYTVDIVTPKKKRIKKNASVRKRRKAHKKTSISKKKVVSKAKKGRISKKEITKKTSTKKVKVAAEKKAGSAVKIPAKTNKKEPRIDKDKRIEEAIKRIEAKERVKEEEAIIETRLREIEKRLSTRKKIKEEIEEIRNEIYRGDLKVVNRGGTPVAADPRIADFKFKAYYRSIRERISSEWALPVELIGKKQDYTTIIGIKIDRDGNILHTEIEESSGNIVFDRSVLKAIEKSNPLPPLPEEFADKVLDIGFRFHITKENL